MCPTADEPVELELSRWHRSVRPEIGDCQRGTAVKRLLYANQSITSLDLSVCYLTHADAAEIAQGLKAHRTLTTFRASGNFFGGHQRARRGEQIVYAPAGVAAIAEALRVSNLTSLGLAENRLGPEGVEALAPGLAATCSLTRLDLSRNSIGVAGAAELASGLAANASLRTLDVRLNNLGPQGAKVLAPGVAACETLTALDARFNGIAEGDEGEAALKEAANGRHREFHLMVLNES